jgi:hypothetical protein
MDLRMKSANEKFSLNTSVKVADQCLHIIREIHECGFICNEINPKKFVVGADDDEKQIIFLINLKHVKKIVQTPDSKLSISTTAKHAALCYASIGHHFHIKKTAADDIESWLYMGVDWKKGKLPWGTMTDELEVKRC